MHPDALDAIRDPRSATGPRTPAGKAASSRNALQTGLYTAHDFIRPGEEEEYSQTQLRLMSELTPFGLLEETFATEIMGATWRLRRCRLVEASFHPGDSDPDPMADERTEKQQKSVDRARAQSHRIIRRCLAEMRTLQTERCFRSQRNDTGVPGLADANRVLTLLKKHDPEPDESAATGPTPADLDTLMALADQQLAQRYRESGLNSFCSTAAATTPVASSFCKPAPAAPAAPARTGRNTPCPCGSGNKYKRCCGKDAPPVLNMAA